MAMRKSGELNIYRDQCLELEELKRFFGFQQETLSKLLYTINAQSFGVLNTAPNLSYNNSFRVEVGTNAKTIKLSNDSYAVNADGDLMFQKAIDNYPIKTENGFDIVDEWCWVRIERKFVKHEDGSVSIDANGNLSGVGTSFLEVFRGQSSGYPVYVQLFKENDNGDLIDSENMGIYEVVDVIDNGSMILGGLFKPESNLRIVCLGAFALGKEASAKAAGGIYNYNGTKISFVKEIYPNYPPLDYLTEGYNFFVARVKFDSSSNLVSVEDKRSFEATSPFTGVINSFNYYYQLNFGDIIVNDKADLNGHNIPSDLVKEWRDKLGFATPSNITAAVANKANADGSKITSPSTWRKNIDAPATGDLNKYAEKGAGNLSTSEVSSWKNKLGVNDSVGATSSDKIQGWVPLPGGMRLQWFRFQSTTDGAQRVVFPYAFPTACVNVQLSPFNSNFSIQNVTKQSFDFDRDNSVDHDPYGYVTAIGY